MFVMLEHHAFDRILDVKIFTNIFMEILVSNDSLDISSFTTFSVKSQHFRMVHRELIRYTLEFVISAFLVSS
jgi:hypothetical protein